jgi:hypothetical protein
VLVVTPLPFTELQPTIYDYLGEPEMNQPLATGAVAIGPNVFTVDGGVYPNVIRLGRTKGGGSGVVSAHYFYEELAGGGSDQFVPLDANRAARIGGEAPQLRVAITGLISDKAKRTDEWGGGAVEGSGIDGFPMFYLQDGHPTVPHSNDRWHVGPKSTWRVGDDIHTVMWLSEGRYSSSYPTEYSIWLIKWRTKDDVDFASKTSITQLGANGTWLHGDAWDLGNGVFFVAERMQFETMAPDGYRDERTRLRAYDYAGNLLHRSDPINEQNYTGQDGSLASDAYAMTKSHDGSFVVGITTYLQLAQSGQYLGYDMQTTLTLRRYTYGGGGFTEVDNVETDVIVSNHESYIINVQEIPDGSGRLFLDFVRFTAPRGTTGWERERVMRLLDASFATLDEVVLPMGIDQEDEWSCIAPGSLGLAGHNDYVPGGWVQESTVYTIQYDPIEGVLGDPTGDRREFS